MIHTQHELPPTSDERNKTDTFDGIAPAVQYGIQGVTLKRKNSDIRFSDFFRTDLLHNINNICVKNIAIRII